MTVFKKIAYTLGGAVFVLASISLYLALIEEDDVEERQQSSER